MSCEDITVRFGALTAVSGVSLRFPQGGIHAVVGQNGAGKTTLARTLAGLQFQDRGAVEINGIPVPPGNQRAARDAGVDMVHQHASVVPNLTVAEALELWVPRSAVGVYRRRSIEQRWSSYLLNHDITVDVRRRIRDLPVEIVQSIEIARSNPGPGGLLILDEPTSVLAPGQIESLFDQLRATAAAGVTVIVVLHKLAEVRRAADTVSVLRNGRLVLKPTPVESVDDMSLSELIVGTEQRPSLRPATFVATGDALVAERLQTTGSGNDAPLRDLSLAVKAGEIVGVAGVAGNGQHTLVEVLAGLRRPTAGHVTMFGADITQASASERRSSGLRVVPFDRNVDGVSRDLPLWQNVTTWEADRYRRWPRLPFLAINRMRRAARDRLKRFGVTYSSIEQPAKSLSGGNLQRLILAREIPNAAALIAAHPTRGLDIGGTRSVWESLSNLATAQVPVLVFSSDLEEIMDNSHRVVVMRGGRITGEFHPPFSRSDLGRAMTGAFS